MDKNNLRNKILTGITGLALMGSAQAGIPVWTFAPIAGYPPTVSVSTTGKATIKYTVTNQSHKTHILRMKPIQGITPSGCTSPLGFHEACTLTLSVTGSALTGDVIGGPELCEQGNSSLCYQPGQGSTLAIHLTQPPPVQRYTVIPSAGSNGRISPNSSQVVTSGATLTFMATANAGYGVHQWLLDGKLVQTGGTTYQLTNIIANHTVRVTFGAVTLTPSATTLALATNCQPASSCTATQNAALTGNPRQITITNWGSGSATNVSVTSTGLPSGTTISSNTCTGTLNGGSSCIITLTPGSVASSDAGNNACTSGTQPVAGTVTITATGGLSIRVNAYVLGYGCQYQGGYIFAVDDTQGCTSSTSCTGSIVGKVVSLTDQYPVTPGIIWSSNGDTGHGGGGFDAADVSEDLIPGVNETSTPSNPSPSYSDFQTFFQNTYTNMNPFSASSFRACQGNLDGQCNTDNILTFYNTFITNYSTAGTPPFTATPGPTPPAYYSGGLCSQTINGYMDWYLPAICEMGPEFGSSGCVAGTQNIFDNLPALVGVVGSPDPGTSCSLGANCLTGFYHSSTQSSAAPAFNAWSQYYNFGNNFQGTGVKYYLYGVRCTRAFQ
ncbi:hypothetical protein OQJ18_15960 [Fluoribacter dumoffii]|uniref:InlB B-repeat-containing protein n=1 Tax=Fluoribacter dumoffii TaxID=463 RepID=UPI00224430A4|nr:hypothetical protein [Fluoribacter dumoffii]MCW8386490.1 hypothetical protein [Fluoribacter dumoffii]MCW8419543.1 hypothetical protein [Fluoribacter dumoffii]MCW8455754.1 hypothetical protein [Fluoribacter dumoffii]MCW8460167.1 hypothetical protein [Fluoribacter dumoffii]MCW8483646.1 hypothetical protein [Fluoribacter dumoffii]